jgi:hypothetical protein
MVKGEVPRSVRLHATLVRPFGAARWRAVWVRYWESQGISVAEQMRMAAEADARRSPTDRTS